MSDVENPNEYNDDDWTTASIKVMSAITAMWSAGATLDDITDAVASALENVEDTNLDGTVLTIQVG